MAKFKTSIHNIEIDFKDKYSQEFSDFVMIYDRSFSYTLIAVKGGTIKRGWIKLIMNKITSADKYHETLEAIYKSIKQ